MILPSAFDEAGIKRLYSIREIFDILNVEFESVCFDLIEYKNYKDLSYAISTGKCPVVDVTKEYLYPSGGWKENPVKYGSTVLVATGIKKENDIEYIQLKHSYADDPNEKGKVYI